MVGAGGVVQALGDGGFGRGGCLPARKISESRHAMLFSGGYCFPEQSRHVATGMLIENFEKFESFCSRYSRPPPAIVTTKMSSRRPMR